MALSRTYDSLPTRAALFMHPLRPWQSLWTNRHLLGQFISRDVWSRYKGQRLGILWSVLNPLIMLAVYTFVFGTIFGARWKQSTSSNTAGFALTMFCGLTLINVFSECLMRASTLIIGHPSYVKKVVFPLEILPAMVLGTALVHAFISFVLLLGACLIFPCNLTWTALLLPVVLLPLVMMSLGAGWLVSALGVFLRDMAYAIGLINQVLMFVTPVFYSIEAIHVPWVRSLMELNPLSAVVENGRRVVIWGELPDWTWLGLTTLFSLLFMQFGYIFFMKSKKAFADVI